MNIPFSNIRRIGIFHNTGTAQGGGMQFTMLSACYALAALHRSLWVIPALRTWHLYRKICSLQISEKSIVILFFLTLQGVNMMS